MEPKRMFDFLEFQLKNFPLPDMLAAKEGGKWKTYSTQEVEDMVNKLGSGLLELGVSANDMTAEGRDKIAVISKNRPEWLMLDLAVQKIGAILVPIYPTISVNELKFILNDSRVKVIFVNDEDLFLKVKSINSDVPSLKLIYTFEHVPNAVHWKEAIGNNKNELIDQLAGKIKAEDLATIIYTSGTTGTPKGVMLSHH
ncbi:MAG TPA: AMP-binding protein, partial [Chitinophagaceae bacterium]|nr:AMP-binding protein [Chitinophagaceae bacterium]